MARHRREDSADCRRGLLFTAFEPSGDSLAAPVIETIRRQAPDVPIWALGGPQMEAAGATLIERTTDHAVKHTDVSGHAQNIHLQSMCPSTVRLPTGRFVGWCDVATAPRVLFTWRLRRFGRGLAGG